MLASFLCSFALNASSTGFPSWWVDPILGSRLNASVHELLALCGSFICCGHSAAARNTRLRSRRLARASATSSPMESLCEASTSWASIKTCRTASVGILVSRERLYVLVTKSSS